jgi:hypothetical protein
MRNLKLITFGMLGALCAPAVYAFQLGTFDLSPTTTIQGQYDDNITSSGTNAKSDFITLITLGLIGGYETKADSLKLKGTITQKVFAKEHDFNNVSEFLSAKYKRELTQHDRITVDNSFTHADQPTSFEDEFGRTSGRYDFYKNSLALGLEHDFTEKFTTKFKYAAEYYDPSLDSLSNSMLNKPGVELAYAFGSRTVGSLFYDYSNKVFEPGGTVSVHSTAAGLRRFLTSQIYVDVKAGTDFIHTIEDNDTIRPNYFIALTDELDETTKAGASFSQSYGVSGTSSELFNSWRFALTWGKLLTERLHFNCGAFTGAGKYISGTKDDLIGSYLGFNYEIRKNIKANMDYTYIRRNSSVAGQDYDRNIVSLGMTINF